MYPPRPVSSLFVRSVSPTSLTNSRGNASFAANHSGTFTLQSCNDGKEYTKKRDARANFANQTYSYLPFSLPLPSSFLKLANIGAGRTPTSSLGRPLPGLKKALSARQTCEVGLLQVVSKLKATIFQDILIGF